MIRNAKAKFQYDVLETVECGMCLTGAEAKSLRAGQASLAEAHARVRDGEIWLIGCHISPYIHSTTTGTTCTTGITGNTCFTGNPRRPRKLLLRRKEIDALSKAVTQRGLTLIPLDIHFSERSLAKLTLALCRGRQAKDKRDAIRKREHRREMDVAYQRSKRKI